MTHVRGITYSLSARRREGDWYDARPKPHQLKTLKVVSTAAMTLIVGGIPCPQTGATHYHEQLGLPDKVVQSKSWLSAMIRIYSLLTY